MLQCMCYSVCVLQSEGTPDAFNCWSFSAEVRIRTQGTECGIRVGYTGTGTGQTKVLGEERVPWPLWTGQTKVLGQERVPWPLWTGQTKVLGEEHVPWLLWTGQTKVLGQKQVPWPLWTGQTKILGQEHVPWLLWTGQTKLLGQEHVPWLLWTGQTKVLGEEHFSWSLWTGQIKVLGKEHVPWPLFTPQIPYYLSWNRTRASEMRVQPLAPWFMVVPNTDRHIALVVSIELHAIESCWQAGRRCNVRQVSRFVWLQEFHSKISQYPATCAESRFTSFCIKYLVSGSHFLSTNTGSLYLR